MTRFHLAQVAPRLARARDQRVAELQAEYDRRRRARENVMRLERLVAHRDLQLCRAYTRRSGRYIAVRQAKLREAQRLLELARRHERAQAHDRSLRA